MTGGSSRKALSPKLTSNFSSKGRIRSSSFLFSLFSSSILTSSFGGGSTNSTKGISFSVNSCEISCLVSASFLEGSSAGFGFVGGSASFLGELRLVI